MYRRGKEECKHGKKQSQQGKTENWDPENEITDKDKGANKGEGKQKWNRCTSGQIRVM